MNKNKIIAGLLLLSMGSMVHAENVTVTYKYQLNGVDLGSHEVVETVGSTPTETIPGYVSVVAGTNGLPEIISAAVTEYTINTEYNASMPFRVSDAENSYYYLISFDFVNTNNGNHDRYYWYANDSNQGKEKFWYCDGLTLETQDSWLWKIQGDWFNGFNIKTKGGGNTLPHQIM